MGVTITTRDLPPLRPLWSAAEARAIDEWTVHHVDVPGAVLMDQAGRHVAVEAARLAGGGSVLVVVGPGNNGGDGWVCARHLHQAEVPCLVLALRPPEDLRGDAAWAATAFTRAAAALGWRSPLGGPPWQTLPDLVTLQRALDQLAPAVVVDAIFGTGLSRPLEGLPGEVVADLARCDRPILAVDLPSGLPTDGQAPAGPVLSAHTTVTFGGLKIAHAAEPGRSLCGHVLEVDIGLLAPRGFGAEALVRAAPTLAQWRLPLPPRDTHKGSYGHVGVLAGAAATAGAGLLAGYAALRAGAGLVSMIVDPTGEAALGDMPELMRRPLTPGSAQAPLEGLGCVVLGPGLGRDAAAASRARDLLSAAMEAGVAAVVDADALPLLLEEEFRSALGWIATPHPKEAARLLGTTAAAIQADRLEAARALRRRLPGVTWMLKGSSPVVALPDGRDVVVPGGARPLAVGGSGDVLAGALGALLSRGLSAGSTALLGATAHQVAGARLAAQRQRGHLAREIADALGSALEEAW